MRRREFLWAAGGAAFAGQPASVLVHEHVLVDFVGADQIRLGRYDRDEVFRIALPKLEEVRRLGCRRLLECTPNFLGEGPGATGAALPPYSYLVQYYYGSPELKRRLILPENKDAWIRIPSLTGL